MARLPRLIVPGQLHLLSQRSHGGASVFSADADCQLYLQTLGAVASLHQVAIHAYALTPQGVLLLLTPRGEEASLARMMQALGRRFGAGYNHRHARTGALWDGRFRTAVVDATAHLLDCMRYVEAACTAPEADDVGQVWSSAAHHLGQRVDPLITEHPRYWALGNTPFEREVAYRALLASPLLAECRERIARAVSGGGWALGDPTFLEAMASQAGRRLVPLPKGRPRKKIDPN